MTRSQTLQLPLGSFDEDPVPIHSTSFSEFTDKEKQELSRLFLEDSSCIPFAGDEVNAGAECITSYDWDDFHTLDQSTLRVQQENYCHLDPFLPSYDDQSSTFSSRKIGSSRKHTHRCISKTYPYSCILRKHDVLLGRGKRSNNHSGNIYFRKLVSEIANRYKKCTTRTQKTSIAKDIVRTIHLRGGRFLSSNHDSETYKEVTGRVLWRKTSQALRDQYTRGLKVD